MPRLDWPEELAESSKDALQAFYDLELSESDRDSIVIFIARKVKDLLALSNDAHGLGLNSLRDETDRVVEGFIALTALVKPERPLIIDRTGTREAGL
jgi:hypothetical protein